MQLVFFHDTQKWTKIRIEDRKKLQLFFLEMMMCFQSNQNLFPDLISTPSPMCQSPPPPGPYSKHPRIKSVRGKRRGLSLWGLSSRKVKVKIVIDKSG